jgi:hypothetical protein
MGLRAQGLRAAARAAALPAVATVAVSCSGLPLAEGASFGSCSGFQPGQVCSGGCASGYGQVSSTCQASGNWSAVTGSCNITAPGKFTYLYDTQQAVV